MHNRPVVRSRTGSPLFDDSKLHAAAANAATSRLTADTDITIPHEHSRTGMALSPIAIRARLSDCHDQVQPASLPSIYTRDRMAAQRNGPKRGMNPCPAMRFASTGEKPYSPELRFTHVSIFSAQWTIATS